MNAPITNPYGEQIEIFTKGSYYQAAGKNGEIYVSNDLEGVIGAFMNDVYEDGQIFYNRRNLLNYVAKVDDTYTKQNNDIPVYMIERNESYLT